MDDQEEYLDPLKTAAYLHMAEAIVDHEKTTLQGATAIGHLEGELAIEFGMLPTRQMLLRVRGCETIEEEFQLIEEISQEVKRGRSNDRNGSGGSRSEA